MKILIINPNRDENMTKAILDSAKQFANDDFEVACLFTPAAPQFIETYEDQVKAVPGMIKVLKENEEEFDAFIIACHCDPNLDVMKEITTKPVVGIGEASMKIATLLGHRLIVLGCAGMTGLDKQLQKELGVPVLDGVICALLIAGGLVKYNVSTSKIRRYKPDY